MADAILGMVNIDLLLLLLLLLRLQGPRGEERNWVAFIQQTI
jgi:hypothetical protein